jgi:hypothetical protein
MHAWSTSSSCLWHCVLGLVLSLGYGSDEVHGVLDLRVPWYWRTRRWGPSRRWQSCLPVWRAPFLKIDIAIMTSVPKSKLPFSFQFIYFFWIFSSHLVHSFLIIQFNLPWNKAIHLCINNLFWALINQY